MGSLMKERTAVVVTTKHRGVFFGLIATAEPGTVELTEARCCVYWSEDTKGVVGLAANGPAPGSRVTPPAPRITLFGVTAIMECTPGAVIAWEREPWSA